LDCCELVDRYGWFFGRCGSLWGLVGRCESLWIVVGCCGVVVGSLWGRCGVVVGSLTMKCTLFVKKTAFCWVFWCNLAICIFQNLVAETTIFCYL
jgi:hypothetical protein